MEHQTDTSRRNVAGHLEALIGGGAFASQFALVPHDKLEQLMVFSLAPAAVARGFLALAQVSERYVVDITHLKYRVSSHSLINPARGMRRKFLVTIPDKWPRSSPLPRGYKLWSPTGRLGLEAVILEAGITAEGMMAELTLVLPAWRRSQHGNSGFTNLVFAKFVTNGYCSATSYEAWTLLPNGARNPARPGEALESILFLAEGTDVQLESGEYGSVDEQVGFPGAERFFAAELPGLGEYLTDLAENLRGS